MRPRAGRSHSILCSATVIAAAFIKVSPLFVLPVRIIRMLKVPEGAAALDRRDGIEVVCGRRRIRRPFESPRIPRIVSSGFATVVGPDQVSQEDQNGDSLEENSDG